MALNRQRAVQSTMFPDAQAHVMGVLNGGKIKVFAPDEGCERVQKPIARRDIAAARPVSYTHLDVYKRQALFLGVCDKIVPGMIMAAAAFGHLPAVFVPAGPMTSGLPNDEKSKVRNAFANGEVGREALMAAEMASYHGIGTCTFYGTANTNQMLMEFMGLHLPGASFVNPNTPLRLSLIHI